MWLEQEPSQSRRTMRSRPRRSANTVRQLRKGEATRRRILDAAMLVVAEEGYHAATHQRIAEAAGLVRTAINYHFPDPDRLSEALVLNLYQLRAERLAAVGAAGGYSSAIEAYWALLREAPFVAIAELECCARTDARLRALLLASRSAWEADAELCSLSAYVLEGLARGGAQRCDARLQSGVLELLKYAAHVQMEPLSGEV